MYVGWNMKSDPITVTPETSVFSAREIMDAHRISHLPVTDGKGRLAGIVTDRDIKEAWASPATTLSIHELAYVLQKLTIANIMTRDVVTATPDMPIEQAALIIHDKKIGALPVVKRDRLVGIITTTDLMEVLLTALGMSEDSRRVSLLVKHRSEVFAEVGLRMKEAGITIRSIVTVPLQGHTDIWQLIFRVSFADYEKAVKILGDGGFKVLTDYAEDLAPYLPL